MNISLFLKSKKPLRGHLVAIKDVFFYALFFVTIHSNNFCLMSVESDLSVIEEQPLAKLWGDGFDEFQDLKAYKGKFVVTNDGKFFGKLYPKSDWENVELFHDMVVSDLGVEDPKSMDIKEVIIGGGKIEIELKNDLVECRLYGKSTIYGDYDPDAIDISALEFEIRNAFDLDEISVAVMTDLEE